MYAQLIQLTCNLSTKKLKVPEVNILTDSVNKLHMR